jgi:hypothetical protein
MAKAVKRDPEKLALFAEADRLRRDLAFETHTEVAPLSPRASRATLEGYVAAFKMALEAHGKVFECRSVAHERRLKLEDKIFEAVDLLHARQPWKTRTSIEAELRAELDAVRAPRIGGDQ